MIGLLLVFLGLVLVGDAEYGLIKHKDSGFGPQWVIGLGITLAGLLFVPSGAFNLLGIAVLVLGIAVTVYWINT